MTQPIQTATYTVKEKDDAIREMTEWNLATVEYMAMLKNRPVGEFRRQCAMAQSGLDFMDKFGIERTSDRMKEITQTVRLWAERFFPE